MNPLLRLPIYAALLVFAAGAIHADAAGFSLFSQPSSNVFIVTDVTPAGKKLTPPTRKKPVYCSALNFGCDFGSMAGERMPDRKQFVELIVKILAEQGYQGNDEAHPPTLMLTFQWGWRRGNLAANLAFLGGDKLDLMWEAENYPWINSNVLLRNMRAGPAARIMEIAQDDLYAITICAFDYTSATQGDRPILLWQTRIAIPTTGIAMADALPRIVTVAGPQIGRETSKPVVSKVDHKGTIEFGELEVIGVEEDTTPADAP